MKPKIRYGTSHLNWPALCKLIKLGALGERNQEKMRKAVENSAVVCSAYAEGELIGFARAISDGQYHAAIYDVVVAQDYQGRGIGRLLMESLLNKLPENSLTLIYVVPGREQFYEKLGFGHLATGMGRFPDPEKARRDGYLVKLSDDSK